MSVDVKEVSTIKMICDDALASALDSRKFADEFIKRRLADLQGTPYNPKTDSNGWTSVTKGPAPTTVKTGSSPTINDNGFEVVGKKGKKKK